MMLVLGDYMKLLFGEGDFSGAGNEQFFGCWAGFLPRSQGFSQKILGRGKAFHTWWGQQSKIKEVGDFWIQGDTEGIILGDNAAGHCFVLRV